MKAIRSNTANLEAKDKQVKNRVGSLGTKNVFLARQSMATYERGSGPAIALYRPVHRAVTRALANDNEAKPPSSPNRPAEAVSSAFVEPLLEYIKTGDLTALDTARGKVHADLKQELKKTTGKHIDFIAEQYVHELRAVKTINKSMEAKSQQAMVQISGRVRTSLEQARNNTDALF